MADIFVNDVFKGTCKDGQKFVQEFRAKRRRGEIESQYNIYHKKDLDFVYVEGTPGRIRRPLIIVENGKSKLTGDILKQLENKEISFNDLLVNEVIEYIDALEEHDCYVALSEDELTAEHTHMEDRKSVV